MIRKQHIISAWPAAMVLAVFAVALSFMLGGSAAFAGSSSATLPNGATLAVSLDSPVAGTQILADGAPVPVTVSGTASIGVGAPQATIVYVLDASASTGASAGACGTRLQCEKTFFTSLNSSAAASGSVHQIGFVAFGADARTADMTPSTGDAPLGAPGDGNTVISSVSLSGSNYVVGQYTAKSGSAGATNYTAALQQTLAVLNASSDPAKLVVFASDGLSNLGGAGFAAARNAVLATGAVVNTLAIGSSSACTGGSAGDLADVAGNGGTCTYVPDLNTLPDLIPNLIGSTLTTLALSVDGGTPTTISNADITPDLPQGGPQSVSYSTQTAGLNPGTHELCVTASGTDVTGGSADTTTCVTVGIYDLVLSPATATNDLGTTSEHTVTATLNGPAGSVGGYLVAFTVGGQNAGATGTCAPADCKTDASGVVTFTYSVPVAPSSLGTDTIDASVTLGTPAGETDSEQVTKDWVDASLPTAACVESVNPHGQKTPPAGTTPPGTTTNGPVNPDGFYSLGGTDAVWGADGIQIFVTDSGGGTVFGPYAVGTNIKYTQDPDATPSAQLMGSSSGQAGAVSVHIIGTGDAVVTAVDGAGNTSPAVTCLVPPKPQ